MYIFGVVIEDRRGHFLAPFVINTYNHTTPKMNEESWIQLNRAFELEDQPLPITFGEITPHKGGLTDEMKKVLSDAQKEAWSDPEYKAKMIAICIERSKRPEILEQLRENGRKGKANWPENYEETRLRNLRKTCEIVHNIEKDGIIERLTKRQFVEKYGGNLASCKQMVWRKGSYKGWKFD